MAAGGRIKRMKQSLMWPWTAHQVEALNDMLELLFRRISDASTITGILPVLHGGTGLAEFEPYQVVVGGTDTTEPLQQVEGVGDATQVLTSNGAGVVPTWEDVAANLELDDLTDVVITPPIFEGDIISWDDTNNWWANRPFPVVILNDLEDVEIISPTPDDVLTYDNALGQWVDRRTRQWSVLTNGDVTTPELIFAGGDVVMLDYE